MNDRLTDGVLDNLDYAAHDDEQIGQATQVRPQTLKRLVTELRAYRALLTPERVVLLQELHETTCRNGMHSTAEVLHAIIAHAEGKGEL